MSISYPKADEQGNYSTAGVSFYHFMRTVSVRVGICVFFLEKHETAVCLDWPSVLEFECCISFVLTWRKRDIIDEHDVET